MNNYPKLIAKCNIVQRIEHCKNRDSIKRIFVDAALEDLGLHLAKKLAEAKFNAPHFLEFELTLFATEIETTIKAPKTCNHESDGKHYHGKLIFKIDEPCTTIVPIYLKCKLCDELYDKKLTYHDDGEINNEQVCEL